MLEKYKLSIILIVLSFVFAVAASLIPVEFTGLGVWFTFSSITAFCGAIWLAIYPYVKEE